MKSIINTSKQGIIALLTLCMLLGIAGTCLNVAAMAETTATVEATMVVTEETIVEAFSNDVIGKADIEENELVPIMANGCQNDYHHYFDNPQHNLGPFLASYGGNQSAAYGAVLSAGQAYVATAGISGIINASNQITVSVNGYNITIRGNVINGTLHIGTFFII